MLTPSDILDKQLKAGLGYDKKDVDLFLQEISSAYSALKSENSDLIKMIQDLNESLSTYKSIEKTLQKALILAEKTAQDTRAAALKEAEAMLLEAKTKAGMILADAGNKAELLEHRTLNLIQQYDLFKIQFENMLKAELELINSKSFSIDTMNFTYRPGKVAASLEQDIITDEELSCSIKAITDELDQVISAVKEDKNQLSFDFMKKNSELNKNKTEDGFEFL